MQVALEVLNGYLAKCHKREGWRMRSWTQEDYIQEGLSIYLAVENHYKKRGVTEPKHLMSLFQKSWCNHIHDRSKSELPAESVTPDHSSLESLEAATALDPDGVLAASKGLTSDAQALITLFSTPGEVLTSAISGIVFTKKQCRAIAARLGMTPKRVRASVVEVLQEFSMPNAITLLAASVNVVRNSGEPHESFLKRIVTAVAKLESAEWDALPHTAKAAHNAMATALNNGTPIMDATPDAAVPVSSKPTVAVKPTTAVKPPRAARRTNTKSATGRAREIMVLDYDIQPKDVHQKLIDEGMVPPSLAALQVTRSESRAILRILREHHMLMAAPTEDSPLAPLNIHAVQ